MDNHEIAQPVTRLRELLGGFTAVQLRYLAARPFTSSDTKAAKKIGISRETVSRWKNKRSLDEAVRLMSLDGVIVAAEIMRRHVPSAAMELAEELDHKRVEIRHKAATQILDRAGVPTETRLSVEAEVSTADELAEALKIVGQGRS